MDIPPAIDMNTPNPLEFPLTASIIGDDLPACDNAITYEIHPNRMDSVKDLVSVLVEINTGDLESRGVELTGTSVLKRAEACHLGYYISDLS